jgi:hypothetical protein
MAYDPMDDDEEARIAAMAGQYPAPRAMSPLSAAALRPAPSFASSLPLAYQPFADMLAANNAAMKREVYDPQRKRLEDYTKELKARRAGPTSAERLYDIGAALMRPTATPGFGGMIANVAPVMAAQRKARREAEDAQRELALKYDLEIGNIGSEEAKGRLTSEQALMKSIMAAQLKAGKKPTPSRRYPTPSGGLVDPWNRPIETPSKEDIAILVGRPDREQAIIEFNTKYTGGAAEAILEERGLETYDNTPYSPTAEGDE